ncbi:hypothetical protein [Pseudomonas sp. dw_358]|uniref:hypothetical protein n=1 Tax=Pseudomonas sp. dw_358 TaxID=2720083 RepID=UPI001BD5D572|nr:hypothetical protein [Pseudomonas sp. dw_358]
MTERTPAPNDDISRQPSPADAERNDPAIDPQGNRYTPDDIPPPTEQERLKDKPVDGDIDVDGG